MAKSKLTPEQKRDNAIEAARELLQMNLLILDTETTGMSSEDQVIELGIIDVNGTVKADLLIDTDRKIDKYAYQVHGITKSMIMQFGNWACEGLAVQQLLQNSDAVVMYNAPFDKRLLAQSAEAHGLDGEFYREEMSSVCLMQLFKQYNYDKKLSLAKALGSCGIKPREQHRAVADCHDTLVLLRYMAATSISFDETV